MFTIFLPLTPGLLNAEKFSEKMPRFLQNSLSKNAVILPTYRSNEDCLIAMLTEQPLIMFIERGWGQPLLTLRTFQT